MKNTVRLSQTLVGIISYFVLFMAAHTLEIYCIGTTMLQSNYIMGLLIRLSVWTLPIIFLTQKYQSLYYLKLSNKVCRGLAVGVLAGLTLFIIRYVILLLIKGVVSFNFNIPLGIWLNVILFVGLSEEVVFRGYLLQKIELLTTFWVANFIVSLLFFIMHFPIWIIVNKMGVWGIMSEMRSIVTVSLLLGYLFKRTESLWTCIVLHSLHNLICVVMH